MRRFREHRLTYKSPRTNIPRSVVVSVGDMAATLAHKLRLTFTVGFLAMITLRTSLRCVARINQNEIDARKLRLVRDESAKLRECPTTHLSSLRFSEPSAFADMRQIFQRQPALAVCGCLNELFANYMVLVSAKVRLFRLCSFQGPPNGFWSSVLRLASGRRVLQGLTAHVVMLTHDLNRLARKAFAIACSCQSIDAQIHANEVCGRNQCLVGQVSGYEQKPLTILTENQIALSFGVRESLALICTHHKRNNYTSLQRQEAYAVNAFEAHHSLVEGHRGVFAELWQLLLIPLVRLTDLGNAAHRHLRRQIELLSYFGIEQLLQLHFVRRPQLECLVTQPVCRIVKTNNRFAQGNGLFRSWQQLNLQRQLHIDTLYHYEMLMQASGASSPCLKRGASAQGIL
jgi:hypothetical protein